MSDNVHENLPESTPEGRPQRELTDEERRAKRRKDFWTLDIPLVFGVVLCTTLTFVEGSRALNGNGRALAYTFEWPIIGAIIVWIWWRYKHEGLTADDENADPHEDVARDAGTAQPERTLAPTPVKKRRSLGFTDHYKARVEEAAAEYAAALHAADEVDHAPVIPESDEGLREWQAYVADLNRRQPPGHPPDSNT
ncbi:MAG: hypothetical protein RL205_641 [Actinomycetota bacterium]|jgi:hypothetical protein